MKLHELTSVEGSVKDHYRKGRGVGSGNGKTAGKGQKGQNSRTGGGVAIGFEGGQNPIYRRLPKRGFKNRNRVEYALVNLKDLTRFEDGTVVTEALLVETKLVKKEYAGVKVLGNGELTKKLTLKVSKVSESAKAAIEKLGGSVEVK